MSFGILQQDQIRRRTVRAQVNPLDKSTVISIYPFPIDETKPTISPGRFTIPAGSVTNPTLLVVGPSSWWREIDTQQPLLEIVNSSIQVADSIVRDYCSGIVECNMNDVMPGLFYIEGAVTKADLIKPEIKARLKKAEENQKRWFTALVKLADNLWARTNGNPIAIGDDMRKAAEELALTEKPWLQDFKTIDMVKCVACGSLRNPLFPVCPTCKAVNDVDAVKKMNLTFAS